MVHGDEDDQGNVNLGPDPVGPAMQLRDVLVGLPTSTEPRIGQIGVARPLEGPLLGSVSPRAVAEQRAQVRQEIVLSPLRTAAGPRRLPDASSPRGTGAWRVPCRAGYGWGCRLSFTDTFTTLFPSSLSICCTGELKPAA